MLHAEQHGGAGDAALSATVQNLVDFDGPPEAFLRQLLATQCALASAEAGSLLRLNDQHQFELTAAYPALEQGAGAPVWLAHVHQLVSNQPRLQEPMVRAVPRSDQLYGLPAEQHVIVLPVRRGQGVRGAAAFLVNTADESVLTQQRRELELSLSLLALYEMRIKLRQRQRRLESLSGAVEVLAAVNQHSHYRPAAMALCNELASRYSAERVSFGLLRGRYVKLSAMSHTEKVNRQMKLSQAIEATMEESLDQDMEVIHPAPDEATVITRAASELSRQHGPVALASLPLREEGQPVAVLTLEREADRPIHPEELELLRLTCELVGPRLLERQRADRWFGARLATQTRQAAGKLVGPQHTWAKLGAVAVLGLLAFLFFVKGTYKAEAPFVVEATKKHVIAAPYDGYLEQVNVEPGDVVDPAGAAMVTLETDETRLKLAEARYQRQRHLKEADLARSERETAKVQIAQAEAQKLAARIDWLEHKLEAATIQPPTRGIVLSGRLKEKIGGPVKKGQTLFKIAPQESLRAELHVPDDEIHNLKQGQEGKLAAASYPGRHLSFVVDRISPQAEIVEKKNIYRVRVRLKERPRWLRPGMKGVAKAHVGQRSYAYIWCHDVIDWIRMKLWI
jgi:biotin carboxyl carrier protein